VPLSTIISSTTQSDPVHNSNAPIIESLLDDLTNEGNLEREVEPMVSYGDQVTTDLRKRAEIGKERYGTYLQPFNGRDALLDSYEEALDLATYLMQAVVESKAKPADEVYWAYRDALCVAARIAKLIEKRENGQGGKKAGVQE
jgi:hypothetical protein